MVYRSNTKKFLVDLSKTVAFLKSQPGEKSQVLQERVFRKDTQGGQDPAAQPARRSGMEQSHAQPQGT